MHRPPWRSNRDPDWPLPDRPDHPFYREVIRLALDEGDYALFRECALNDFWFFCRYVLSIGKLECEDPHHEHFGKKWLDHPWAFARCRELQENPNGFLDLWPRYHFKTALITQSLTIWDLADNRNLRFAIITYKIDTAGEGFVFLIKAECQNNELLRSLFPDTFFWDPVRESPQWTLDALTFRRDGNPKEPSISLASLMSTLTSFHVHVRVWDDLVTEEGVATSDAIDKTTEKFQNFAGIAADFVVDRATGTHWAVGDTWTKLLRADRFKLRYHDLYEADGVTPVLRSIEWCNQMYRDMTLVKGISHWMCVMRNRPDLGGLLHFERSWLKFYDDDPLQLRKRLNVYIIIDTSKGKTSESDFTTISVIGLGAGVPAGHYYLLDLVRDRIGLVAMTENVFRLVEKWRPLMVFIEEVGTGRDGEHLADIQRRQDDTRFRFDVMPYDEKTPKAMQIGRLQPIFKEGRFWLPRTIHSRCEGHPVELIQHFLETEYGVWTPSRPSKYDDILDNLSRVRSPKIRDIVRFPLNVNQRPDQADQEDSWRQARRAGQGLRARHSAAESFWAQ